MQSKGCQPFLIFDPKLSIYCQFSRRPISKAIEHRYRRLQVARRKVGVSHGHGHVRMAQELLDRLEPYSVNYQVRSKGVSQVVKGEILKPPFLQAETKDRLISGFSWANMPNDLLRWGLVKV